MISVVQRVSRASVSIAADGYRASIGPGLCVLLGVEQGDTERDVSWMAKKLAHLRIFRDENDKMNLSVQDVKGAVLLVSQFTLSGDCTRGNRPSFVRAAPPEHGDRLYRMIADRLRQEHGVPVQTGVFGAMMDVSLINDGPVTIILRTNEPDSPV